MTKEQVDVKVKYLAWKYRFNPFKQEMEIKKLVTKVLNKNLESAK